MARWVHTQDAGPDWVGLSLKFCHTLAVGRECRILVQHARHIGIAKDQPTIPVLGLRDGLCGTHCAIPIEAGVDWLFVALCMHIFRLSSMNGLTALVSLSTILRF